jgi:nucleoid-associated protein YgaU
MASYYKTIDGKNYDKAILDMAKASVAGQGDGRISLNDAKKIVRLIKDGGKVTDTEKRSLQYILKKYKFTDTAEDHIKHALGKKPATSEKKQVKKAVPAKKDKPAKTITAVKKKENKPAPAYSGTLSSAVQSQDQLKAGTAVKEKKSMWKYILTILVAILLILGIYYLYMKFRNMGTEQKQSAGIQADSSLNALEPQKNAEELKTALQEKAPEEIKPAETVDLKNRYVIKEGDTLVKISTERYNDYRKWELIWKHNKGVLKSPIMIFPGQVIELPEDK